MWHFNNENAFFKRRLFGLSCNYAFGELIKIFMTFKALFMKMPPHGGVSFKKMPLGLGAQIL